MLMENTKQNKKSELVQRHIRLISPRYFHIVFSFCNVVANILGNVYGVTVRLCRLCFSQRMACHKGAEWTSVVVLKALISCKSD